MEDSLTSLLKEKGIIPGIIQKSPEQKIQIRYGDNEVNCNELTPLQVKDKPSLVNWNTEEGQYYTLLMIDPDAPLRNRPIAGPVKHWLVMNIPCSDISKGEDMAAYAGAGPPQGTGLHRYVFLVYKQPSSIAHSEVPVDENSHQGRMRFKLDNFVKKYNLGEPIAVNFFESECDEFIKNKYEEMARQSLKFRLQKAFINMLVYFSSDKKK